MRLSAAVGRAALVAAALCAAGARAQDLAPRIPAPLEAPLPADPMGTTIHRLSNGLTVYLSPNHLEPRIAAQIAVRAGSKNDPAESTGIAHYLEHMLFKGTSSLGTTDYERERAHLDLIQALYEDHFSAVEPEKRAKLYKEIDAENVAAAEYEIPNEMATVYRQMGFRGLNAYTSDEETVYVCDLPANRAEAWARMEAERFAHPVFRLFQNELEIVYEEKNRSIDNPERLLGETLNAHLYKVHPYGQQTTLGSIEHLKNPSLSRMYDFFTRYYVPNNMALALSGDFDRAKMLALLEKAFSKWTPKPLPAAKTWALPPPKGVERFEVKYEAEEKVVVSWLTAPNRHPDADALAAMDMLMDNAAAGIINLTLTQAQKVKSAGSSPSFYNDAGDWEAWAVPKLGQSLEQAEALLLESVAKLKAGQFSDEDLKAVVTNFEVGEKARLESNEARAGQMASSFVRLEPWEETVGRLDRLRRVTKEDVVRVANKYLGDNRVVVYRRNGKPDLPNIAKPEFTKVSIDAARQSKFAGEILALPAPPLEPRWLVDGRDYTITPLPSGRLYAAANPVNDLFSLTFDVQRGSRHERKLCPALQLLELSGAGDMTAEEYKKKLFSLGTSISYGCGEQESEVSISGLDKNLWPSLELMLKRFDRPNVSDDTLKKMVEISIGAHQDNKREPQYVYNALGEFARHGRESAVLAELGDKELQGLKLSELKKLISGVLDYKSRIGYVGNRTPGELAKLLESPRRLAEPPAHLSLRLQKPAKTKVYFTHRDMVQSQVGVFAADEEFKADHALDYSFYSSYVGGGMSSLIFQEVREARSLAYAAWGGYEAAPHKEDQNEVYGGLGCQADKTIEAATLLDELLQSPPLSEKRFRETEKALEENFRTNPITFRAVPGALQGWEDQGITGGDPRPARFARLKRYTLEDLKAFTSRFKEKPMTLYILGHRDRVGLAPLSKLYELEEKGLDALFPY